MDFWDFHENCFTENSFVIWMQMVLLKYLRKKAVLPNLNGPLLDCMPSAAISSANKEVKDLVDATPSSEGRTKIIQTRKKPE